MSSSTKLDFRPVSCDSKPAEKPPMCNIKYVSLVLLVLQTASFILAVQYTRILEGRLYYSTTAAVVAEFVKMCTCLIIILVQKKGNVMEYFSYLWHNIVIEGRDTMKIAIVSFIFTIQSNILLFAMSNLSVATYQVSYKLKILITALFCVLLLGKKLTRVQWLAVLLLFIGVAIVQIQPTDPRTATQKKVIKIQPSFTGMVAVLCGCVSSGFASVYFEKILKRSQVSLWLQNVKLFLFGTCFGLVAMRLNEGDKIDLNGFFFGYNKYVYTVIALQVFGGLLVTVVLKYADNILKGFAQSLGIIISTVASVYLFEFTINLQLCIGAGLVLGAIFIYSQPQQQTQSKPVSTVQNWQKGIDKDELLKFTNLGFTMDIFHHSSPFDV